MTDNLKRPGVYRKSVYFFFTMSVHDFISNEEKWSVFRVSQLPQNVSLW